MSNRAQPLAPPRWSIAATSSGSASPPASFGCLVGGMMLGIGMDLIVNGQPLGWLLHAAGRAGLRDPRLAARPPAGAAALACAISTSPLSSARLDSRAAARPGVLRVARSKANGAVAKSAGRWTLTLAIDIGGTHLKAGVLGRRAGTMTAGPSAHRHAASGHPRPWSSTRWSTWSEPLGRFDRISIGFPGVVRDGRVTDRAQSRHRGVARLSARRDTGRAAGRAGPHGERRDGAGAGRDRRTRAGVRDHAGHRHGLRAVRGRQTRAASGAAASTRCAAARPTTSISATQRCTRWGGSAGTGGWTRRSASSTR